MSWWGWALKFIGIGWYVAFSLLLPTIGGLWLDSKFKTAPILALVGLLLGTVIAFYGLYAMLVAPQFRRRNGGGRQ